MATVDQYKIVVDVQGQQQVESLKQGIVGLSGAIASVAIGAFVTNLITMADAISDVAAATGFSTGQIYAFQNALVLAGGDADTASKNITKFYNTLYEAANGSKNAQASLAEVGITLNDLKTLSEEQLLDKAVAGLAEMDAGARRTAVGVDLFGKSFASVDPTAFQDLLTDTNNPETAANIQKLGDAADWFADAVIKLRTAAINVLGPFLGQLSKVNIDLQTAEALVKAVGTAITIAFAVTAVQRIVGIAVAIGTIIPIIVDVIKALRAASIAATIFFAATGPAGWAIVAGSIAAAAGGALAIGAMFDKATKSAEKFKGVTKEGMQQAFNIPTGAFPGAGAPAAPTSGGGGGASRRPSRQIADDYGLAANRAKQVTSELKLQNEQKNELRQLEIDLIGVESNRAQLIRSNREAELSAANEIADLEAQINLERAKGTAANQEVVVELQAQIQLKNEQLDKTKQLNQLEYDRTMELKRQNEENERAKRFSDDLAKKLEEMNEKARQQNPMAGAMQALEDAAKYTTPFEIAQDSMMSALGNMNRAIDDFVDTGKFKFADFARSMIADIMKIIIKALVLRAVMSALGMPTGTTSTSPVSFGDFFRAKGGPVTAGKPYIVGEKGAEMFVPNSNGSIVPNNQLGGGQPPIVYNITNNISALDAKSVAQMFVENRKTLLGATNMARKETPYGA